MMPSRVQSVVFRTLLLQHRLFLAVLVGSFADHLVTASDSLKPDPEVPTLAAASNEGQLAIATFRIPEKLECNLFAAEPMLGNPVAFGIDRLGNIYVCESYRQHKGVTDNRFHDKKWLARDLAATSVEDRIRFHRELLGDKVSNYERFDDLIRVLRDTNHDGVADDSIVFASGFNHLEEGTGSGVLIRDDRVYFTNIPNFWALKDDNGDFRSDQRQSLYSGFGVRVSFRGHDLHGLVIGPDGRLYFSIGDRGYSVVTASGRLHDPESGAVFRCELDGSNLEVIATGLRNPQELAFDDEGNLFTCDNNSDSGDRARWTQIVAGGDSGWRMMYQYLPDRGPFNREKIWHPYSPETPAYIVPPIENLSDGPSGLAYYPGVGLDDNPDLRGSFFLCDFRGQASNSGIRRIKVQPKGAHFEVVTNEEYIWNVLATDVDFGPDASLFLSDWVNGWNGENKGRIYRFTSKSQKAIEAGKRSIEILKFGFKRLSVSDLVGLLKNPDRRLRFEAQWELAARAETTVLAELLESADPRIRLHAVWGLGQIARYSEDKLAHNALLQALGDDNEVVVARACEMLAESKLSIGSSELKNILSHSSPIVLSQAMLAVGRVRAAGCLKDVAQILMNNADRDPIVRHAGIMALAGTLGDSLDEWTKHSSESVRIAVAVALRKAKRPEIATMLDDASVRVVREVARAIYDVPELHTELSRLASLRIVEEFDPAIVGRIIHANYRLGGVENATKLLNFATSRLSSVKLRAEAVGLLGDWGKPGLRDKFLNRHLPLEDREAEFVKRLFQESIAALASTEDKVRDAVMKVGADLEIQGIAEILEGLLLDASQAPQRRADAIRALGRLRPERIIESRKLLLSDPETDVRVATLQALAALGDDGIGEHLETALQSSNSRERQAAWNLLGFETRLSGELVESLMEDQSESIASNKLPADTQLDAIEAVLSRGSAQAKQRVQALVEARDQLRESQPRIAYADCLEGGDVSAGRELFFTRSSLSCVRCHKVGDSGGEVGPNLSQIGSQKDAAYLLESIVAPDAAIAVGYETVVILTEDDETFSGILRFEDEDQIQIMDNQGKLHSIEKQAIVVRNKGLSSMPNGLMNYLNRRELRDLVAYLKSLDGTPDSTRQIGDTGGHR